MIITVSNLKGGTGKTTLAVNLAAALRGYLIDADPQGTAAVWLGKGQLPISGQHLPLSDGRLKAWLQELDGIDHRPLLIDCPPSLAEATKAAFLISDLVIIPVTPSGADLWATQAVVKLLAETRMARQSPLACLIVPSRIDRRTSAGRELPDALTAFGEPIGPAITQRAAHVDAFTTGQWIGDFAPNSPGHAEILDLAVRVQR